MERALLQGEREAEVVRLRQEQEAVQQLQEKLSSLDASIRKERDKVTPVTGPHCHQLCHALPGTHSHCCNASCCSIPCGHVLQTLGSAEALGGSPCGLRCGGICLPGLGQTALLQESTANAQEAFQLLPVALAGRLWCDGCCLQWVVLKQRPWHSPITCPCWGTASCSKSPHCCTFMCDGSCYCSVQLAGGGWETTAGV